MKKLVSLMMILAAVAATPAFSASARLSPLAFASDSQTVPVMVNAGGLGGATYSTYVAILNPTSSSFDVAVTLWDNAGIAYHATIALEAGEQKLYANFLDSVFHFSGAGTVRFRSLGSSDNLFILNAEVYTVGPSGRFGTAVPAAEFPGTDAHSFAAGVTINSGQRANVGCFNESGTVNHVIARVFDGAGHEVETLEVDLAGHAWRQTGVDAAVTGGYIRFEPSQAATCYAVVVNNATNDGRFIPAVEYAP